MYGYINGTVAIVESNYIVIDNNGDADAIIKYTNGQFGREICSS